MTRNILSEAAQIIARGKFTTGDTVTMTVYRNATGSAEALDSASCIEQDGSGYFLWPFSNLTNAPVSYSDYLWIMSNGTPAQNVDGVERFGGYPDTISSIAGANQTTITVEETDTTAIAGVSVQVQNAAQTVVLDNKTTDASGQVVFALDDGTYKIVMAKPQTSFTVPEDLTVSGTTVQTYNGTPLTIVSQAGAGECEVSMFVSSQRPTIPLSTLGGTAQITALPTLLSEVYYSGQKINGIYDGSNKRIYWVLPQGSVVEFKVKDILGLITVSKSIPAENTKNFQDLEDR